MKNYQEDPSRNEIKARLIDLYLKGKLSDDADCWFEEKLERDPHFREEVMARHLVMNYFENQGVETEIQTGLKNMAPNLKNASSKTNKLWGLPAIYLVALAASMILFFLSIGLSPKTETGNAPFVTKGMGFNSPAEHVTIVFHDSNFWGGNTPAYHWEGEVLHLHGAPLYELRNLETTYLEQSNYRNHWTLHIGNAQFLLNKSATQKTPLIGNVEH